MHLTENEHKQVNTLLAKQHKLRAVIGLLSTLSQLDLVYGEYRTDVFRCEEEGADYVMRVRYLPEYSLSSSTRHEIKL